MKTFATPQTRITVAYMINWFCSRYVNKRCQNKVKKDTFFITEPVLSLKRKFIDLRTLEDNFLPWRQRSIRTHNAIISNNASNAISQ